MASTEEMRSAMAQVPGLCCREWAPKLAPNSPYALDASGCAGERSQAFASAQRRAPFWRAAWHAPRPLARQSKKRGSLNITILLPALLYFIPSVIAERIRHHNISKVV
jgi:hypothetical protein